METPAQLVVGTGGDLLETDEKYNSMVNLRGEAATLYNVEGHLWNRKAFGFVLLTRDDPDSGWKATFYDINGDAIVTCSLGTRSCN